MTRAGAQRGLRAGAVVLVLAAAAWGGYELLDPEDAVIDEGVRQEVRASGNGSFVRLSDGFTHYEVGGPDSGAVVVLAAGASVPYYIWDPTFAALTAAGFRVIRYDYLGRGYSDRPDIAYTQEVYVRQLGELLDSLRVTAPVALAGLSYGGTIITSFAAAHPERVGSLIYVDPAIHRPIQIPALARLPGIAELLFLVQSRTWASGQLDDFLHPEKFPDWVARYRVQMGYTGFRRMRHSDAFANAAFDQMPQLAEVGKHKRPVLVLWGKQDKTVPFERSADLLKAMSGARFVPVDSSGHLPQWEQPAITHGAMLEFLRGRP